MSTLTTPFEPYLTQGKDGGSLILDRNLLAIKKAIQDANATIFQLHSAITNVITSINITTPAVPVPAVTPPGLDLGADFDADMPLIIPGKPGQDGKTGQPGPLGADGEDGDMSFIPGPQGQKGEAIKGPPGPQGDDGDEAGGAFPMMQTSGIPLGTMASDPSGSGDVLRFVNGDSTVRGADGFFPYSRTVAGPYVIFTPSVLTIEDNAILTVI